MKDRARLSGPMPDGASYFCDSYKQFFDYAVPKFMQIAAGVKDGSVGRHIRSADRIRLKIAE